MAWKCRPIQGITLPRLVIYCKLTAIVRPDKILIPKLHLHRPHRPISQLRPDSQVSRPKHIVSRLPLVRTSLGRRIKHISVTILPPQLGHRVFG
jgi:hypothetical protein